MTHRLVIVIFLVLAQGRTGDSVHAQQASEITSLSWQDCCGLERWPQASRQSDYGSLPRHELALVWGVPEPYRSVKNPLLHTEQIVREGAEVYARYCVSCHGDTGTGDGPAAKGISPSPGNLAWLSQMPMAQWDPFMFWTIAEGGTPFGTAMPRFKEKLFRDEIWAVTAYIQARLPNTSN